MSGRFRPARIGLGLVAVAVGLAVVAPVAAANDANGSASCMGIELSAISPPGTSDEIAGGAPEFVREVRELAASLGLPQGGVDRLIARVHAHVHYVPTLEVNIADLPLFAFGITGENKAALAGSNEDHYLFSHDRLLSKLTRTYFLRLYHSKNKAGTRYGRVPAWLIR